MWLFYIFIILSSISFNVHLPGSLRAFVFHVLEPGCNRIVPFARQTYVQKGVSKRLTSLWSEKKEIENKRVWLSTYGLHLNKVYQLLMNGELTNRIWSADRDKVADDHSWGK